MRQLLAAICLTMILACSVGAQRYDKFTPAALKALGSDEYATIFWVFLDSTAWSDQPMTLTPKASERRAKADPTELLVDSLDYPIKTSVVDSLTNLGMTVRRTSRWLKAVTVELDSAGMGVIEQLDFIDSVDVVRTLYRETPDVDAKLDRSVPDQGQSAEDYGESFFQNQFVDAVRVHDLGYSGDGVMLALFDTGFDTAHPGFENLRVTATYDFINESPDVTTLDCPEEFETRQQGSHGTSVLGVIAGEIVDTLLGLAPNADFLLAKTEISCFGTEIRLEEDNFIAALEWADSIGADIVSASLGYYFWQDDTNYLQSQLDGNTAKITIAADIAASRNILVVTSAGNDRRNGWGTIAFPADGDSVLAVGATNFDSTVASFSSDGPTADGRIKPDVAAFGVGLITLRNQPFRGVRRGVNGTSFSAPIVAGVAALAMERLDDLTADQVFHLLRETASQPSTPDNDLGYGIVNAYGAAGLIELLAVEPIIVAVGQNESRTVSVRGMSSGPIVLRAENLPLGVQFLDNLDGTGEIAATGSVGNPIESYFSIIASDDEVTDTLQVLLQTVGESDEPIYLGPNPFSDQLDIFTDSTAGQILGVSIYNVAGEKIWENINHSSVSADAISRWDRVRWDGRNQSGASVAAGVYLIHVEAENRSALLKVLKSN